MRYFEEGPLGPESLRHHRRRARFWGAATATVNWCERDYAITPYVAEFYNALSSLAFVAYAALGLRLYGDRRVYERRFVVALWFLVGVGVGSALFHATLWRSMQLLDELPMVYVVLVQLWVLLERWSVRRGRRRGLGRALAFSIGAAAFTVSYVWIWRSALWHQVVFGALMVWVTLLSVRCLRETAQVRARRLYTTSVALYAVGFVLWNVDNQFCHWVRPLHLHAVWHLCMATGAWLAFSFVLYDRLRRLAASPEVHLACGLLPYVVAGAGKPDGPPTRVPVKAGRAVPAPMRTDVTTPKRLHKVRSRVEFFTL
ncbi:hypothetical protein CDCA_CDCA08G2553 [Cyanidium caldarium]|uniref:Alkaline phytoceramidase n=1 Tax=Cyanidium caldarium TaxID=2771 RepID=A0AAV9IWR2_CYACA|nr:hypothetical protein CDCA_CDCA08G2553 [Cyanidium caldarium]